VSVRAHVGAEAQGAGMNIGSRRKAWVALLSAAAVVMGTQTHGQAAQMDYGGYRPHYQGYGVNTPGGRGGVVLKVTNLNDSGPGSLRAALSPASCTPRFVVFETSGTIQLSKPLDVTCPFVTIAGQTAPSPGIEITTHSTYFDTHDVVIQHLRFRMGDAWGGDANAVYVRNNASNVVFDHVSISWGMHTNLAIHAWSGPGVRDVAVLDCIISEGLARPDINPYGVGTLFYPTLGGTATVARNLWAHNGNRNPWFGPGWHGAGYNNVAYNAAGLAGDPGLFGFLILPGNGYAETQWDESAWPFQIAWVSNVALAGPNTHPDTKSVKIDLTAAQAAAGYELYLADNTGPHMTLTDQWDGVTFHTAASESAVKIAVPPAWFTDFQFAILPNQEVLSYVLANAGARPRDRDSVDTRIVNDVVHRTGSIISSQKSVGGYPILAVNTRPYVVPVNPNAVAPGQTFRTNIEADLEAKARTLEAGTPAGGVPPAPDNLHLVHSQQ
jgi:hypothetical protein